MMYIIWINCVYKVDGLKIFAIIKNYSYGQ